MNRLISTFVVFLLCLAVLPNTPIKVACVGNSVTYGAGIEEPTLKYPAQLQEMLGEDYHVRNFGHSGATLLQQGHRPYIDLPEYDSAIAFQPDIVIIHLGLNDTDPRNWPLYRDEFVRDYTRLIQSFSQVNPRVEVMICRMTPIFTDHRRFASSTRDWFWQVQEAIEVVAKANNVALIDLHTPLHRRPDLFPDALHPTGEGATFIAEKAYGAITGDYGGLQVAPIFGDGMVLQRNQPIQIWGKGDKNTRVTVRLNGNVASSQVGHDGEWELTLPPLKAGGPYALTVQTEEQQVAINDILLGDVWVCSGQSNMAFELRHGKTAREDISMADYPTIRLLNFEPVDFTDNRAWSQQTLDKINRLDYFHAQGWQPVTPQSAEKFSAIAYHFGRVIHQETDVPIGLILNAVGGAPTEAWIDRLTLEHHPRLVGMFPGWGNNDYINGWVRERAAKNIETGENPMQRHPYHPAYLYEAGIQDITRFPITGVIWYQGESNEQNVELHDVLFPTLVQSWRNAWKTNFPFYYVQLSSMAVGRETWGHFRDSQRKLLDIVPNSGMAVSSDLGDSTDVHPRDKKPVGERLARLALHHTYGMKEVVPSGPLLKDATLNHDRTVHVAFTHAEELRTSDGGSVQGFEMAEHPGLFYPAIATIEGNQIKASSPHVDHPRFVRYGWSSYSNGNVVNGEGLPASTFHTEITQPLNLLPLPQQVRVHKGTKHRLPWGNVDPATLTMRQVERIPEAVMHQEEAYRLRVTEDSIVIEAVTEKGFYWAKQTLHQLAADKGASGYLPQVEIIDWPAFRVRGFMHDVGRSYISVAELKKQIALLSRYKINVFHWHLTENQGWRLESKRFPELNDSAHFERLPGMYYTIEDAREIADWCKQHNMLLIPEIDMPGHSAAFVRATGVDMQSRRGMEILKELMEEIATEVFPDLPYIHIGTDEVQFTNPAFVPEMVAHIRSFGKKVISWNPGWNYKPGEIDATQLWSYRGKAQTSIPAIDSRFHYINHFDAFGDIVALHNSRVYNAIEGSDDLAGSILAIWNDRLLPDEEQIMMQNHFYPNILAFADRTWRGGGFEYFDENGPILPTDTSDPVFQSFAEFERRLLWHKDHFFANEPFPYVKQTDIRWRITAPFPNEGELTRSFPPEEALQKTYTYAGETYPTRDAVGAGIYLRHVWDIVPSFYDDPKENHTAYAYTWVWSPISQEAGLWVSTQDYSRSESDLPPPQGKWDYKESRIFLNDQPIQPPVWENTHSTRNNEITLKNENFTARPPLQVPLKKGWNKVLLKLPIGKFTLPEVRLQKWMFTFVFVTPDGRERLPGLIYDPDKCTKPFNNEHMNINWERIGSEGLKGDLSKGVSAAYAAVIQDKLVVAGGANFPGKLGFEGGSKAFYDEILLYNTQKNTWEEIGKLPQRSAYGVSVSIPDGALWIGGNTATESLNTSYKVALNHSDTKNISVELLPFVELPATMDNFAGCAMGSLVFVAGGNVDGKPSNALHFIDVEKDAQWTALPSFPGAPRVQPVLVGMEVNSKPYLYLMGGFFGGDEANKPEMATDVLRYDVWEKTWETIAQQVDSDTGKWFSLGGATAMPIKDRYILCLGGVNHDIFLHAITTQHSIGHDRSLTEEERRQRNFEFSAHYMTQPTEYYRFNPECRVFDVKTGIWSTIDRTPNTARAGATLVWKGNSFYAIQGELKPGVRSPETWKGTFDN